MIVTVWPAMMTRAVRSVPGFAVFVMTTVPFPLPLAGVTVSHDSVVPAVHAHPASAVTVTEMRPATGAISKFVPLS